MNNKDEEVERLMYLLLDMVQSWLDDVESLGNQTAFSDRGIEAICEHVDRLKQVYESQFSTEMHNG